MKRSIMNLRIDIVLVQIIIKTQAVSYLNDIKAVSYTHLDVYKRQRSAVLTMGWNFFSP